MPFFPKKKNFPRNFGNFLGRASAPKFFSNCLLSRSIFSIVKPRNSRKKISSLDSELPRYKFHLLNGEGKAHDVVRQMRHFPVKMGKIFLPASRRGRSITRRDSFQIRVTSSAEKSPDRRVRTQHVLPFRTFSLRVSLGKLTSSEREEKNERETGPNRGRINKQSNGIVPGKSAGAFSVLRELKAPGVFPFTSGRNGWQGFRHFGALISFRVGGIRLEGRWKSTVSRRNFTLSLFCFF